MKKLASLVFLGLAELGILISCFNFRRDVKNEVLYQIEAERLFDSEKYSAYITNVETLPSKSKTTTISYDFNNDRFPDIRATFFSTERYASGVMEDRNNDGAAEIIYADLDGDGYLEVKKEAGNLNPHQPFNYSII